MKYHIGQFVRIKRDEFLSQYSGKIAKIIAIRNQIYLTTLETPKEIEEGFGWDGAGFEPFDGEQLFLW